MGLIALYGFTSTHPVPIRLLVALLQHKQLPAKPPTLMQQPPCLARRSRRPRASMLIYGGMTIMRTWVVTIRPTLFPTVVLLAWHPTWRLRPQPSHHPLPPSHEQYPLLPPSNQRSHELSTVQRRCKLPYREPYPRRLHCHKRASHARSRRRRLLLILSAGPFLARLHSASL